VKLVLQDQLYGHFSATNLPGQTPQTGFVIIARRTESKLGAKLLG
jgi:hypothetical protein